MRTKVPASKSILLALLAALGLGAQAAPVVFASAQYDTVAFAVSGSSADADSAVSPTSPLPILSTATVTPANDFATAAAFADAGLLFALSEADSFPGAAGASAGAQSHFVGTFLGTGGLSLHLVLDSLSSLVGGATSDATLFVLLTNTLGPTTTTLFNDFFTASTDLTLNFGPLGGIDTLDLLLFSEANTTGAGQSGQNFSQVSFAATTFDGTIPLPATLPLVVIGLAAMLAVRRKPTSVPA